MDLLSNQDIKYKLKAAPARYNLNFDKHFRRRNDESNSGDQFIGRVDMKSDRETKNKLERMVDGPLLVTKVGNQDSLPGPSHPHRWEFISQPRCRSSER